MKILLLDDDHTIEKFLEYFTEFEKEWSYLTCDFNSHLPILFDQFDFVVVDNSKEKFKNIFQEIIATHPLIKTIVISDVIENCSESGCEQCKSQFKRKRLFKPVIFEELYNLIKDFDLFPCQFYEAFESVKNIIPSLLKQFSYFEYDLEKELIHAKTKTSNNRYTYEFISIINILEKNNISFVIEDEYHIKIL